TAAGFSLAAARSVVSALEPIVRAEASDLSPAAPETTKPFTGTGGELLAEQLQAFDTRFVFICNSSGMGPLCDAVVDRPGIQFIPVASDDELVGWGDGSARARGA